MTKDEIKQCASKMMLDLNPEEVDSVINELEILNKEFERTLDEFPGLNEVLPMIHTIDIPDVILRDDVPVESPDVKELLKNATHIKDREIEVPKVVG